MKNFRLSVLSTSLFCASVLAAAAQPALAADETVSFDFYGQANVAFRYADYNSGSENELVSYASRIGVKGGTKLDNGIEVIYQLEWEVDLTDLGGDDN